MTRMTLLRLPSSGRVTWLFLRLLGVIYGVAFASLSVQVLGLIGHDGILPASLSDAMLRALSYGGVALAILLIAGIAPIPVLGLLWADYLTLSNVSREFLSYQWDALLLETGLIAVFLAPPVLRERHSEPTEPSGVARWLMIWLLIRLMVGSGAVKLTSGDPTWRNLTAMTFHYETQPIPTPLAWYAHHLPLALQKASTAGVFLIELLAPWCVLLPWRRVRMTAFVLLVGLQVLIALTGNYAFFNLLSVALCLFLLDENRFRWSRREYAPLAFAVVTVPVSLTMFFFAVGIDVVPPLVGPLYSVIAPLRSVNSYGLFAVMTTTRDEIVVEGSDDGVTWRAYEFKYKPGDVNRRPPWVAPHQPRLDWQMWFASLTTYENVPWYRNFCVRLLQGSPDVLQLLASNPFPNAPPRYVRGALYRYHFGKQSWWTRERIGEYSPTVTLGTGSRQ